jgi:hypothetical protein
VFPDKDPVIINVLFGIASGLSALIVGKIGDMTVTFFFLFNKFRLY